MKKTSRLLVIDASVICAAGPVGAEHPISAHCRDILKAIYEICHRCTVTKALRIEWNAHSSRFSQFWRVQMTKRGKLLDAPDRESGTLRHRICAALPVERWPTAAKDLHLVEAAIAAQRVIISCDDRARRAFAVACSEVPELGRICWVSPATDGEDIIKWLRGAAPSLREWNLDPARERA